MLLTLKDQEVELVALGKADELDDIWVIDASHDLDLFEDVGSLYSQHGCLVNWGTRAGWVQMLEHRTQTGGMG